MRAGGAPIPAVEEKQEAVRDGDGESVGKQE
jgi:hypothetical protein